MPEPVKKKASSKLEKKAGEKTIIRKKSDGSTVIVKKTPKSPKSLSVEEGEGAETAIRRIGKENGVNVYITLRKVKSDRGGLKPLYEVTDEGWELAERLYGMHCSEEEVAVFLGLKSAATLHNRLNDEKNGVAHKEGKAKFYAEIRNCQKAIMQRGDSRMAIWLGKQYLGQQDTVSQDITVRQTSDPATMSLDDMMKAISRAEKKFSETGDGDDDKDLRGRVHRRPPSLVQGSP